MVFDGLGTWNYKYVSLNTALKRLKEHSKLFVHAKPYEGMMLVEDYTTTMNYLAGYYGFIDFGLKPFDSFGEAISFLQKEDERFTKAFGNRYNQEHCRALIKVSRR